MQLSTAGIVLRSTSYSDADAVLNLFTHKYGKIGVYAKNARRMKSPLMSSAQPFAFANYWITTLDGGRYRLSKADLIDNHYKITEDFGRINLGYYYLQFTEKTALEGEPNAKLFTLLVTALGELKTNENLLLQKNIFDLNLSECFGYKPNIRNCILCGKKDQLANLFDYAHGGRICPDCAVNAERTHCVNLDSTSFRWIHYVQTRNYAELIKAEVHPDILREVNRVMDRFIDYHFDEISLSTRKMLEL